MKKIIVMTVALLVCCCSSVFAERQGISQESVDFMLEVSSLPNVAGSHQFGANAPTVEEAKAQADRKLRDLLIAVVSQHLAPARTLDYIGAIELSSYNGIEAIAIQPGAVKVVELAESHPAYASGKHLVAVHLSAEMADWLKVAYLDGL